MKRNRWFNWIGVAGLGLMLSALAAPAVQALTVTAFVVKQTCLNGDFVQVTLSATVSPAQPAKYRWDFTNNGTFDTALNYLTRHFSLPTSSVSRRTANLIS